MKHKLTMIGIGVLLLLSMIFICSCDKHEDLIPVKYDIEYIITGEFSKAYAIIRSNKILDTLDPLHSPTHVYTQAQSGQLAELHGYLFSPVNEHHWMILEIKVDGISVRRDSLSYTSHAILKHFLPYQ